jgi:hypothetical protein
MKSTSEDPAVVSCHSPWAHKPAAVAGLYRARVEQPRLRPAWLLVLTTRRRRSLACVFLDSS